VYTTVLLCYALCRQYWQTEGKCIDIAWVYTALYYAVYSGTHRNFYHIWMYPQLRFESLPPMKLTGIAPGFRTTHVKEFFPGISCKLSPCSDHNSYAIPHLVFFPYTNCRWQWRWVLASVWILLHLLYVTTSWMCAQCRICTEGQHSVFRFLDTRVRICNVIVVWVLPLCYHECKSFQTLLLCCAASSRCVFDAKWPRFVPGPPFTCPQLLLACKCIHVVSLLW